MSIKDTPPAAAPMEFASLEHRHRKLTPELRSTLSKLRDGTVRCTDCAEPAISLRNGNTPLCALCGTIRTQRRTAAMMRPGSTR